MNSAHPDRKQKIKHELREMLELFLYLAFFFCALAIYDMLLLKQYSVEYWTVAFALINAAVITKVIMIGEYAKIGKRYEYKLLDLGDHLKSGQRLSLQNRPTEVADPGPVCSTLPPPVVASRFWCANSADRT